MVVTVCDICKQTSGTIFKLVIKNEHNITTTSKGICPGCCGGICDHIERHTRPDYENPIMRKKKKP